MTVSRDCLVSRGAKIVRGVTDVVELFRDGATELMNQTVACVGDIADHNDTNREEGD